MIKQISSAALIFSLSGSLIQAAEIKADSHITAVTVYPGSAKVIRNSRLTLTAGKHSLLISNLPLNIVESSLRVAGEGQGKITLGSVELQRNIQQDVVQEQERNLRLQIEEAQEQRKEINDAISRNRSQLVYIKKMVMGNNTKPKHPDSENKNGSYTNLPLEQWQQAWQTLDTATSSVQEKIRASERKRRNKDKELNKLKRELQQVATNQKETRSARLFVEAEKDTEIELNLSYQINGARWEPVYDADLNTETGEIELKTLAQISQRTGEDWSDINVTLSTLRPGAGSQLPPLNSWALDFLPEPIAMSQSKGAFNSEMMESDVAMSAPAPMMKLARKKELKRAITQQQSRLIATDFSAEYIVPEMISLKSGSDKRRFSLTSQKLQSKVSLASAPRFDPRAMIIAKTKYTQDTPLIAGSMSLYRNGDFIGNTFLQQKLSGEKIKLSFGEDNKVKIKFMPDHDKKRKDGILFGKKKVVDRHYKIRISSNHSEPHNIAIFDVIPVASHEDIKVRNLGDLPNKKDIEDKEGVVSWERTLAPKKEIKINYGYSVSYPEDRIIPGL